MVSSISSFDFLGVSAAAGSKKPQRPAETAARLPSDAEQVRQLELQTQREKLEELRRQMRDKVLEEKDADKHALGGLAGAERAAFVRRVEEEVDRRTRQAVEDSLGGPPMTQAAAGEAAPPPMFLDISV